MALYRTWKRCPDLSPWVLKYVVYAPFHVARTLRYKGQENEGGPKHFVLLAKEELGITQSKLAEKLNLTQSAIRYAVRRGKILVEKFLFNA